MSLSTWDKSEKNNSLNIPEILADFFLRKIDMSSHSDDSDCYKYKNKRKKSKHKKRKHKKSKHRHRNNSSDSSYRGSDSYSKDVVGNASSSEEMGIQRLKKIKKMKLQSVNQSALQTVSVGDDQQIKDKSDASNSSMNKKLSFCSSSLNSLLSSVESNNLVSKIDAATNVSSENNCDLQYDISKKEAASFENKIGSQNDHVPPDLSLPLHVDNNGAKLKNVSSSMQICDENIINGYKNNTNMSPEKSSYNVHKRSVSQKISIKRNCRSKEKSKSDKQTYNEKREKHSRSRSRSKSCSKRSSPKSKHRKKTSRSSSRDSCHSYKKRERHDRSRSHSKVRKKFHGHERSHSRSHSKSRYGKHKKNSLSLSPHERHNRRSRSRSQSFTKHWKHSNSRTRQHSHCRHRERSSSKSKYKSKSSRRSSSRSRSRSKSKSKQICSKEKSRSRSKSNDRKSSQSSMKIDQAKILETARRNVLKMMKNGTLPEGLPVENLKKEQLISIQAGGKSVQELTDFCQRLSQKENDPDCSDNEDQEDKLNDETGFIHHPFKVKDIGQIKLNIKNAVQLPIKTQAQKVAETARLSSQFPVSSGNQHKQKELEWIPVVPASTENETKSVETNVTTNADSSKTVEVVSKAPVSPIPSSVSTIPMPVSYPILSSDVPKVSYPILSSDVPKVEASVIPPLLPPPLPPLPPTVQSPTLSQTPIQPVMPSWVPSQEMTNSCASTFAVVPATTSIFKRPKKLDIPSIVAKRFQALTKLQENPSDPDALKVIKDAQQSIQEWVESQQVPGLFTGSTDAKVLSVAELCGPKYNKFRKDILSHAPPVTEGKGMSLLKKMGWNPGEGLGKNKEGSLEPLMLDIKMDKKGLVSEGENSKKGSNSFTKELQGKHPVSALMELCSKRRWKQPLYTCVLDQGPPHRKMFCFKVEVNGVKYQPLNPCSNKKVAKADAAVLCLQSLNILSKTA